MPLSVLSGALSAAPGALGVDAVTLGDLRVAIGRARGLRGKVLGTSIAPLLGALLAHSEDAKSAACLVPGTTHGFRLTRLGRQGPPSLQSACLRSDALAT